MPFRLHEPAEETANGADVMVHGCRAVPLPVQRDGLTVDAGNGGPCRSRCGQRCRSLTDRANGVGVMPSSFAAAAGVRTPPRGYLDGRPVRAEVVKPCGCFAGVDVQGRTRTRTRKAGP